MKRISTILWTNKEPEDKNILWLNKRKLYLWENGWVAISGSGGSDADLSNYLTKQKADKLYQPKGNYASQSSVNSLQDTTEFLNIELGKLLDDIKTKQDRLTAGQGINITGNTISCTLDTNLYVVVNELPVVGVHNKIYLVKDDRAIGSNVYTEYIYTNDWEILGEYHASVDLKPYALKTEIPKKLSQLENDADYATVNEVETAIANAITNTLNKEV